VSLRLDLLRQPRFRTFLVGYGTSALGSAMAPVATTFALLDTGRSAGQVGQVLAAYALAITVSLLAGGAAADMLGRRTMMVLGNLLGASSQLTLAALVITGRPALWVFIALQAVDGSGQAFYAPALSGLIPELVVSSRLQQANALMSLAASAGAIAGPAAAGVVAAAVGPGWAILANGVSYLVSAACLARLPGLGQATPGERFLAQLRAGWQVYRSLGWLWPITAYDAAGSLLVLAPYEVLGAVVARASLGGAGAWGTILAGQGAGAMLGGLIGLWIRPAKPLVVAMIGRLALIAPLLLLIFRAPVPIIVAGACLAGVGIELFLTLWSTTLQRLVPAESLSRVSAFDSLGVTVLAPVGYAMVGLLAAGLGVNDAMWLAASTLAVLSVTVACLPAVRAVQVPAHARQ
jgi:MFS family permease